MDYEKLHTFHLLSGQLMLAILHEDDESKSYILIEAPHVIIMQQPQPGQPAPSGASLAAMMPTEPGTHIKFQRTAYMMSAPSTENHKKGFQSALSPISIIKPGTNLGKMGSGLANLGRK